MTENNDNRDDVRELLRRGADQVPPLDPARVIAGAHRRRRVRGLVAAGAACAAVVAVVAGGVVVAGNGPSGQLPPVVGSPTSAPTSGRTAVQATRPDVSLAACLAAMTEAGRPAVGSGARTKVQLDTASGTTLVIATQNTWLGCDRSRGRMDRPPALLAPEPLTPPSTKAVDPFRVASLSVTIRQSLYDRYWAAGLLPAGIKGIRYTFPDGARRDAKVVDRFWAMQYQSTQPTPPGQDVTKQPRIKVELIGANGRVVKVFRLSWLTDTCAQINHGC